MSPNLLKSKVTIFRGGGVSWKPISNFVAESKFAKIQSSHFQGGRGGSWGYSWKPISNFCCWVQICSNPKFTFWGGGAHGNQFPTFVAECPNLLKSKVPIFRGGACGNQFPTFVAEVQSSHFRKGGGVVEPIFNFWCRVQICLKIFFFFCRKLSKFSGKNVPGNGFGLWVPSQKNCGLD